MTYQCHKCQYNGTGSPKCIECLNVRDTKRNTFHVIPDGYDAPAKSTAPTAQVTSLDEDAEDRMRKFLFEFFDLEVTELALFRSIMHHETLTDFCASSRKAAAKLAKMTRHNAYQLRKSINAKMGGTCAAPLLTAGQRKPCKVK